MQTTVASQTEYTIVKPDTSLREIELLCKKAVEDNVAAVCVPPLLAEKAKGYLDGSTVKLSTVIAFPYGYSVIEAKLAEIIMAIVDGVDELDVVINMTALKNNDWQYLATELNTILPVVRKKNKSIKIVVESSLLTEDELIKCCDLYGIAGIDYLVLSTGTTSAVPSVKLIESVRNHLADSVGIKVSGHFLNQQEFTSLIAAGAGRIGQVI
jgi:deoxyribose-phosphate aldolase